MNRTTLPTRRRYLDKILTEFQENNIVDARRNVEWILSEVCSCSRSEIYADPDLRLSLAEYERINEMKARRLQHEPLQYILGYSDFRYLRLKVSPATLIPRPETEGVIDLALQSLFPNSKPRILDIGTGSGCIALSVKQEWVQSTVEACDVSPEALEIARYNAQSLGLTVHFVEADLLHPGFSNHFDKPFDLILSNPPYIPDHERDTLDPEVQFFEPAGALFTGSDPLLYYRALARHALKMLATTGRLIVETHTDYAQATAQLFSDSGFREVAVKEDLSKRPRYVVAHL